MRRAEGGTYQKVTILHLKVKDSFHWDKGRGWEKVPFVLGRLALPDGKGPSFSPLRTVHLSFPHLFALSKSLPGPATAGWSSVPLSERLPG